MKNKYIITIIILIIIVLIPLSILFAKHTQIKSKPQTAFPPTIALPANGTYVTEDSTTSPNVPITVVNATIARKTKMYQNQIWQEFVLTDTRTGSQRTLFNQVANNIQYEPMKKSNWSPTDRFFYIFYDYPDGRRNLLMFQTDGRFTYTHYYLIPVILTNSESITKATWFDNDTLYFDLQNQIDNSVTHYEVDLNDSTGVVKKVQN